MHVLKLWCLQHMHVILEALPASKREHSNASSKVTPITYVITFIKKILLSILKLLLPDKFEEPLFLKPFFKK